jgi:hypothetical protein
MRTGFKPFTAGLSALGMGQERGGGNDVKKTEDGRGGGVSEMVFNEKSGWVFYQRIPITKVCLLDKSYVGHLRQGWVKMWGLSGRCKSLFRK